MAYDIGDRTLQDYKQMQLAGPVNVPTSVAFVVLATSPIATITNTLQVPINPMLYFEASFLAIGFTGLQIGVEYVASFNGGATTVSLVNTENVSAGVTYQQFTMAAQQYRRLSGVGGGLSPIPVGGSLTVSVEARASALGGPATGFDAFNIKALFAFFVEAI